MTIKGHFLIETQHLYGFSIIYNGMQLAQMATPNIIRPDHLRPDGMTPSSIDPPTERDKTILL